MCSQCIKHPLWSNVFRISVWCLSVQAKEIPLSNNCKTSAYTAYPFFFCPPWTIRQQLSWCTTFQLTGRDSLWSNNKLATPHRLDGIERMWFMYKPRLQLGVSLSVANCFCLPHGRPRTVVFGFFVLGNLIWVNLGTLEHLGHSKIDFSQFKFV